MHIATFKRQGSLNICDVTRSANVSALPPSHSGEQETMKQEATRQKVVSTGEKLMLCNRTRISAFEDANRDDKETMPLHIDSVDSERDDTDQLSVATDDLMFRMEELLKVGI